ncbi:hypothetical protein D3C83_298700 [compost metagenome]
MREMSRMSSINESKVRAEAWMVATKSRCSVSRPVVPSSSLMPMTPFNGVRIS